METAQPALRRSVPVPLVFPLSLPPRFPLPERGGWREPWRKAEKTRRTLGNRLSALPCMAELCDTTNGHP